MTDHFWSTHGIPKETEEQVHIKIGIAKASVALIYICILVGGIALAPSLASPRWPIFVNCTMWHCIIYAFYSMGAVGGMCLISYAFTFWFWYYAMHINIQLHILSAYFEGIGDNIQLEGLTEKKQSVFYQRVIRKRLLIGIKQHIELMR